ncbi:hypothetical protein ACFPRL_11205 [Pseudoclavibacter helvolus]
MVLEPDDTTRQHRQVWSRDARADAPAVPSAGEATFRARLPPGILGLLLPAATWHACEFTPGVDLRRCPIDHAHESRAPAKRSTR